MKIINTVTGETVSTMIANHSMSLDEAINLVGEIFPDRDEENVLIGGSWYYYDDLAMDWEADDKHTKMYNVHDKKHGKRYSVSEDGLYDLAFDISLKHRAAVYFGEDATAAELIDDMRGCGCRVEEVEE